MSRIEFLIDFDLKRKINVHREYESNRVVNVEEQ
jgi:hypothetical protein